MTGMLKQSSIRDVQTLFRSLRCREAALAVSSKACYGRRSPPGVDRRAPPLESFGPSTPTLN